MTIQEYQEFIRGFQRHGSKEAALKFIEQAGPFILNLMLGIQEEIGELSEVILGHKRVTRKIRNGILLESGDVLWQITATLEAFDITLEDALEATSGWKGKSALATMDLSDLALALGVMVGKMYQAVKRCLRDGEGVINERVRSQLTFAGGGALWRLAALLGACGCTLEEAMAGNIEKLQSRVKRGVVQGEGSNR